MSKGISVVKCWVLGAAAAGVLWLLYRSIRWQRAGLAASSEFMADPAPKLAAFWHRRQLMMSFIHPDRRRAGGRGVYALISRHGDGRIIAFAVKFFGINSIAGSSSRGGREAARELIDKLRQGYDVVITPDGPRGPAFKAKAGVIRIARELNLPVQLCSYSVSRFWEAKSWDRMIIPKPFSKGVFYIGEPFHLPADFDEQEIDGVLDDFSSRLSEVDTEADRIAMSL